MISFRGSQLPQNAILFAVYFYLRYSVSYRDLEEILAERGVTVDHTTLNRWVTKFSPLIALEAQKRKRPTSGSWRMDETYIKVKGKWHFFYRAVDKFGKTLVFMLSDRRNTAARVSCLLCMSEMVHASHLKEHDDNDDIKRTTRRAA